MDSTGFAPSPPVKPRQTSAPRGIRQRKKTTTLVHLLVRRARISCYASLVVLFQVHAVVQAGDLIAVTVEHQRVALEDFAKAAFLGLAPAWVVHIGIHIRIEAVLVGGREVPGRRWHFR